MSSYLSADFEKDYLAASEQVRVIVRSRDDGDVPPSPSALYYPTDPDLLVNFIVGEYISDVVGERFVRVATTTDVGSLSALSLVEFYDSTADFISAGVGSGDVLNVTISDATLWTSSEYPSPSPFLFYVEDVLSATRLRVSYPFPAFAAGLTWDIPVRSISGTGGVTRRYGNPVGPVEFLDRRFNALFNSLAQADAFVAATKASMTSLVTDDAVAGLVDESYTATPSV
jgi:hypothetical protein